MIFDPQIAAPGDRELIKGLPGTTRYEISTMPFFLLILATRARQWGASESLVVDLDLERRTMSASPRPKSLTSRAGMVVLTSTKESTDRRVATLTSNDLKEPSSFED